MFLRFHRFSLIQFILLFAIMFFSGLCISCKKKVQNEGQTTDVKAFVEVEDSDEATNADDEITDAIENEFISLFDFYSPALDNAEWVEELLLHAEEERIAEQMNEMESSLEEYQQAELSEEADITEKNSEIAEASEVSNEIEKYFENNNEGKSFSSENGQLKFYEAGNEILVPQKSENGQIVIHADGKKIKRIFYDELFRIVKREEWDITEINSAKLNKSENLKYKGDGYKVISKTVSTENDYEEILYNDSALIQKITRYVIVKEKKYKVSERHCLYNADNKITSDENIEYKYKQDYKKLDYSFAKKYVYTYNEGDVPPDFSYYENDVLKMKNKYASDNLSYTSQVFFDNELSVKTYYENGIRLKDVYYKDDKVLREKLYEQTNQHAQEVQNEIQ